MRAFLGGTGLKDGETAFLSDTDLNGTFKWDSSSTDTDDGVDVIKITTIGTGRFIRLVPYSLIGEGMLIPEDFGADPTGVSDSSAAFQAMFDSMGTVCGSAVKVAPGSTYLIGNTVQLPQPTSGSDNLYIESWGVVYNRVASKTGAFFARRQDDLGELTTGFGNPHWFGGVFFGDNTPESFGIECQQSYQAYFHGCRFVNCDAGFVGTFAIQSVLHLCEATNCRTYGFLLRSGSSTKDDGFGNTGVWASAGSSPSSSASNACELKNCRNFGQAGMTAGYAGLGADNWHLEHCINEGNADLYDVFFDYQDSTGLNNVIINHFWSEASQVKVNFKIRSLRNVVITNHQRIYPAALFDFAGSSNLIFKNEGVSYLGNMPKPAVNIAYATAADGSTGFSTTSYIGATYVGAYIGTNSTDKSDSAGQDNTNYTWADITLTTSTIPHPDGGFLNIAWANDAAGTGLVTNSPTTQTYCGVYTGNGTTSTSPSNYTWLLVATNQAHVVNADANNPLGRWFYHSNGGGYGGTQSGQSSGTCYLWENIAQTSNLDITNKIRWEAGVLGYGNFVTDCSESSKQPVEKYTFGKFHKSKAASRQDFALENLDFLMDGTQVLTTQQAAVTDASGGATVDTEARTAINSLLARLRTHGLIGT